MCKEVGCNFFFQPQNPLNNTPSKCPALNCQWCVITLSLLYNDIALMGSLIMKMMLLQTGNCYSFFFYFLQVFVRNHTDYFRDSTNLLNCYIELGHVKLHLAYLVVNGLINTQPHGFEFNWLCLCNSQLYKLHSIYLVYPSSLGIGWWEEKTNIYSVIPKRGNP